MGEFQRVQASAGLYGRLLQRLATALDDAQSVQGLVTSEPQELELRGLTPAELGLINAYLERDLSWLQGWHAAAREFSSLERRPSWSMQRRAASRSRLLSARRGQFSCALCGSALAMPSLSRASSCQACGSTLFRLVRAGVH
ncbi:hypothetical protein ACVTMO_05280 [Pseudomonas segetis]|uniref:Zinc-ribbon containing domain-containing protein n=1 Tax=Pseudomonas segetis TaxID=298908 RepID=A0A239H2A3_9PSED|nr:hypothetical protein [Pseudomonas segetis]SNS75312.1 hypothetical protein SAMN05216255_3253 [Pseudomonas segetis]